VLVSGNLFAAPGLEEGNTTTGSGQEASFPVGPLADGPVVVLQQQDAQDNLLLNPGFENPIDESSRWVPVNSPPIIFERSQVNPHSGLWAAIVSGRELQWHSARYGLLFDQQIIDGQTYQLEMWARTGNPEPQTLRLLLFINDDRESCPATLEPGTEWCACFDIGNPDIACLYGLDAGLSDSSTWISMGWQGKISFDGTPAILQIYIDTKGGEPLTDIYLDDVSLVSFGDVFDDGFE